MYKRVLYNQCSFLFICMTVEWILPCWWVVFRNDSNCITISICFTYLWFFLLCLLQIIWKQKLMWQTKGKIKCVHICFFMFFFINIFAFELKADENVWKCNYLLIIFYYVYSKTSQFILEKKTRNIVRIITKQVPKQ